MSANSALVKLKMVNGLIGSILDENGIKIQTLFPNIPKISSENQAKIEKLLDSRNRVKETIDEVECDDFTDELNLANFFFQLCEFLI